MNIGRLHSAILISLFGLASIGHGAALSLDELEKLAVSDNAELAIESLQISLSEGAVDFTQKSLLPDFKVNADGTQGCLPGCLNRDNTRTLTESFSIEQNLTDLLKYPARIKSREKALQADQTAMAKKKKDLLSEVRSTYFNIYFQMKLIRLNSEEAKFLSEKCDLVARKVNQGHLPQDSLLQTKVQLSELYVQKEQLEVALKDSYRKLRDLLNFPLDKSLVIAEPVAIAKKLAEISMDQLSSKVGMALSGEAEVSRLHAESKQLDADAQSRDHWPSLSLGHTWYKLDQDERARSNEYSFLSLSWNLKTSWETRYRTNQGRHQAEILDRTAREYDRSFANLKGHFIDKMASLKTQLSHYELIIKSLDQLKSNDLQRFERGLIDIEALDNHFASYLRYESNFLNVQNDFIGTLLTLDKKADSTIELWKSVGL